MVRCRAARFALLSLFVGLSFPQLKDKPVQPSEVLLQALAPRCGFSGAAINSGFKRIFAWGRAVLFPAQIIPADSRVTAEEAHRLWKAVERAVAEGIPAQLRLSPDDDVRQTAFAYYFLTHSDPAKNGRPILLWPPEERLRAFQIFLAAQPELAAWAVSRPLAAAPLNDLFRGISTLRRFEQWFYTMIPASVEWHAAIQPSLYDLAGREQTYQGRLTERASAHPEEIAEVVRSFHRGDLDLPAATLDVLLGLHVHEGEGAPGFRGAGEATLNISSPYTLLREIFRAVGLAENDVFLDAGAGYGRPSLYAALVTRVGRSLGIEIEADRLLNAIDAAARFGLRQVSLVAGSIRATGLLDATVIFIFNPFSEDTLTVFLAQAQARTVELARTGKALRIVSVGGLSTERLARESWLALDKAFEDGPAHFYIFKSHPAFITQHIIARAS